MSEAEDIQAARDYITQLKSELGELQIAFQQISAGQAPDRAKIQHTLDLMSQFMNKHGALQEAYDADKT